MKSKYLLLFIFSVFGLLGKIQATTHVVTNSGLTFTPADISVNVGDTVVFNIGNSHNAVEVSKATYDSRGMMSNGGFNVPFGGGSIVITEAKTYYYVCQPHVNFDMVGTITATEQDSGKTTMFTANLSGSNEATPVLSSASGQISGSLDGNILTIEGRFSGLTGAFNSQIAGGSHIHRGFAGQNGGIELALVPTLDSDNRGGQFEAANNSFELTDEQLDLLLGRQLYINIHTTVYASGELRGQLLPASDDLYLVNLFGSNEVPSVISQGFGALALEVTNDSLYVSGSFQELSSALNTSIGGGAHLHMGLSGENGGVVFPLNVTLGADSTSGTINNVFPITEVQKEMLIDRRLYANFHSMNLPSGELRGQIRGVVDAVFRSHLSGNNQPVPVTSKATGEILLELKDSTIIVSGSFQGLSSALNTMIAGGAHIHLGIAGQNGGVLFPLVVELSPDSTAGTFAAVDNQFVLSQEEVASLLDRKLYINIHSLNFGPGEIRGQIVPESQFFFTGFLTGMQQPDPVISGGYGAIIAEIMGNNLTLSGAFNNLDTELNEAIAGGAHLHLAPAGSNGPVEFLLMPVLSEDKKTGQYQPADNTFTLTEGLMDTLIERQFYANIHSLGNASGELRAQLLHESTAYFFAPLSGASESNPVNTNGNGAYVVEWNDGQLIGSGSFNDLTSDFDVNIAGGAHLHAAYAGSNGGILQFLNTSMGMDGRSGVFEAKNNILGVSSAFVDTLLNRTTYVNIHSTDFPSGEIRGQVLPFANNYFTATLSGINEVQPVRSGGSGAFKLELNGNNLVVTGSFNDLEGDFDPNIGGGAHIHQAITGSNGDVVLALTTDLGDDLKSGIYTAANNTFVLEDSISDGLKSGRLYFNIHTTEVPSGELRGQILPETNQFPNPSAIIAPASGAMITIEGEGNTPFEASWNPTTDPDADTLSYIWQLAADPGFNLIALSVNQGEQTNFQTDFATVNGLLRSLGIQEGQSINLYHRVMVSDGSLFSTSEIDSVTLTVGIVTDIEDLDIKQMSINLYPNPAQDRIQLNIKSTVNGVNGELILVDLQGRVLQNSTVNLQGGAETLRLDVNTLPSGIYFAQIWLEGRLARTTKFEIQR